MIKNTVQLSPEFRAQTTKAIAAIGLFILTYLTLLGITLVLTAWCVFMGFSIIIAKPSFITLPLGGGLASLGLCVLFFLVKFVFKSHKVDRSDLYEVTRQDQPELFRLIEEIVQEVGADFPKKVYFSSDVNAAVFYDSGFWSMFLPVRKNLLIGMGLINSTNQTELKAVLAHEFGHFSQRTMKVGSYVYHVNRIIFNLLHDNDSYAEVIKEWKEVHVIIGLFISLAVKIIHGIQWILSKLYEVVNKNYLALSREMEFHADEIAASVTGAEPLQKALLRALLAREAFERVLGFYEKNLSKNLKSINVYCEHRFMMRFMADRNELSLIHELPMVSKEDLNRFNRTKLVVKDQWASHPSTEERVDRLDRLGFPAVMPIHISAIGLLRDAETLEQHFTNNIFAQVQYQESPKILSPDAFEQQYKAEYFEDLPSPLYNDYYTFKSPTVFEMPAQLPIESSHTLQTLFSDQIKEVIVNTIGVQEDLEIIKQIADGQIEANTFDYDGIKYTQQQARRLAERLTSELEALIEQLKAHELQVLIFFHSCEHRLQRPPKIAALYQDYFAFIGSIDAKQQVVIKLQEGLASIHDGMPPEQIRQNFSALLPVERQLKVQIREMLADERYQAIIPDAVKARWELYLSQDWEYFGLTIFDDENLGLLADAYNYYIHMLAKGASQLKSNLIRHQEELLQEAGLG